MSETELNKLKRKVEIKLKEANRRLSAAGAQPLSPFGTPEKEADVTSLTNSPFFKRQCQASTSASAADESVLNSPSQPPELKTVGYSYVIIDTDIWAASDQKKKACVYIGQTSDPFARMCNHRCKAGHFQEPRFEMVIVSEHISEDPPGEWLSLRDEFSLFNCQGSGRKLMSLIKECYPGGNIKKFGKTLHTRAHVEGEKLEQCEKLNKRLEEVLRKPEFVTSQTHRISCPLCDETFATSSVAKTHLRLLHGDTVIYTCEDCDSTLLCPRALSRHKAQFHGATPIQRIPCAYGCVYLDGKKRGQVKTYSSSQSYTNHLREFHAEQERLTPVEIHHCPVIDLHGKDGELVPCEYTSSNIYHLYRHMKDKHPSVKNAEEARSLVNNYRKENDLDQIRTRRQSSD